MQEIINNVKEERLTSKGEKIVAVNALSPSKINTNANI